MNRTKQFIQKIKRVVKRRKKLLFFTPVFFVVLSLGALQFIEPKYKSTTSILVQKEEALNPLILYDVSKSLAPEDQLPSVKKIIYSRSTMDKLIDSLYLNTKIHSELTKQGLVDQLRNNIKINIQSSNSFEIIYFDADPVRARDGVAFLANRFIRTRKELDKRRNRETVKFFQTKIRELEEDMEDQHNQIVNTTKEQLKEHPIDQSALQTRLQNIDSQLDQLEWQIIQEESKLENLNLFLNHDSSNFSVQPLFKLPLESIPLGNKLGEMLGEYDQLRQQFTDSYPQVRSLRKQIFELCKRIPPAIESKLSNLKMQKEELSAQRASVINNLEKSFVASQRNNSRQSNFKIYQELYNDMKLKLEQARMSRDIGGENTEQFVFLDPPNLPNKTTTPSRNLVVASGLFIGLLLGVVFTGIAEMFDTTVRKKEDLELDKPVIAYLSDGKV